MDTNKGSNLVKYLKDKYGEDSVKLLRNWEFIVKMADYRNHRCFTLRCIKVRITSFSCKIKNPLQFKTARNYHIIHKAEINCCMTESEILTQYWICRSIIDFLNTHT